MKFDFDTPVDRSGTGNLKPFLTPETVKNRGLLGYCGAEFDFKTAPLVCDAIRRVAERGLLGYTLQTKEYIERVQWWMEQTRGYSVSPEWVVPTQGTIFSLATTIRLCTDPGDSIMTLSPTYNRYAQAARRLGRKTVVSKLKHDNERYYIDWDSIEEMMVRPDVKVFVLSNPNNPTGTVWLSDELKRIADIAAVNGVTVFSDEIFADVRFCGNEVTPYTMIAGPDADAITSTSLGKAFSLTGVNHANMIIENPRLRERFIEQRNADHYGSIDPVLYEILLSVYTPEGKEWIDSLTEYVRGIYRYVKDFLEMNLDGVKVFRLDAGFTMWLDFANFGLSALELQKFLEEEAFFAGDMGPEFGGDSSMMRINIATPKVPLTQVLNLLLEAAENRGITKRS